MSNDDYPDGYYDFINDLDIKTKPNVIAAFCPNFDEVRNEKTVEILNSLKIKGYDLYFWVIEHQFNTKNKMDSFFIDKLKNFGKVEIYSKCEEADLRASSLKDFIKKYT